MSEKELEELLSISLIAVLAAGKAVMDIYENSYKIEFKKDNSPLTYADLKSNEIIVSHLSKTFIPIISEELASVPYETRKNWKNFWIVDPLDGTKEFIQRNGEFTINVALVEGQKPILGIVYAPAINSLFFSTIYKGGYKLVFNLKDKFTYLDIVEKSIKLKLPKTSKVSIAASRSHLNLKTLDFIQKLKDHFPNTKVVNKGSSLKFCMVADGIASIYPRFGRTMEWDTAAGHAILNSVSGKVCCSVNGDELLYNKPELSNADFIATDYFFSNNNILSTIKL